MTQLLNDGVVALRAIEPTDVDTFTAWENDTALWEYGSTTAPFSRKLIWDYVQNYQPDIYAARQLRLVAVDVASGTAVGAIDFYEFDPQHRRAGVGVLIDREWQGRGYGKRMLQLGIDYASRFIGMHQLWAMIPIDNIPSQKLFRAMDFDICGRLRSWLRRDRSYVDAYFLQHLFES
jgi:diamine N-acetyltransferase